MATTQQRSAIALELRRTIKASREQVYRAWTTPEELKKWSAPHDLTVPVAEVDLRVGGRFRIDMQAPNGNVHRAVGTYRVVDPPKRLVYTWRWEDSPDPTETLITVEFIARGNATEVRFVHEGLASEDSKNEHTKGWNGCLDKLEARFGSE